MSEAYRVVQKIHLGAVEPPTHLDEGDEIEFDGSTITKKGGQKIELRYPAGFLGAIKAGWLVPLSSNETTFKEKPAGVEVNAAQATGHQPARVDMKTALSEERDLGTIAQIRPEGSPQTHVAKNAGQVNKGAPTGAMVISDKDSNDGVVVGKFSTPAKAAAVEIGKGDQEIKNKLDNAPRVPVIRTEDSIVRKAVATGDVQEARSGETLEELLPEATSAGKPESSPKDVVLSDLRKLYRKGELNVEAICKALELDPKKVKGHAGYVEPVVEKHTEDDVQEEDIEALLASLDDLVAPEKDDFQWDMSVHWRSRANKAVELYKKDPSVMDKIIAVEQPGVQKFLREYVQRSQAAQ